VLADESSIVEPHDVDQADFDALVGRGYPSELASMSPRQRDTRHRLVASRDHILDGHLHVWKRCAKHLEEGEHSVLRGRRAGLYDFVLDEVVGHQLAETGDVSGVDALVAAPHCR
jgi:hypothetical protein